MSAEDAERLQHAINEYLARKPEDLFVELDQGSDVMDLSANADVLVSYGNEKDRVFTIVTLDCLQALLRTSAPAYQQAGPDEDLYSAGGPLVIVRKLTGETIVRAVMHYLRQEGLAPEPHG